MSSLSQYYLSSRRDNSLVVLEGFHAIKHALLFGVSLSNIHTCEKPQILKACRQLSPDLLPKIEDVLVEIDRQEFNILSPNYIKTGIISTANKPNYTLEQIKNNSGFIVYLDHVRNLKNLGSIVRLCAARGVAGIVYSGTLDAWNPECVSVARGLQFAVPIVRVDEFPPFDERPAVCFDERGDDFTNVKFDLNSVLVFGSERSGISGHIKAIADEIVRIPMNKCVSSLNLATSVGIAIYH
jgi:RNA methyltransferase, TrmH family